MILGIDTSHEACSVCLCKDETLIAQQHIEMNRGHAEALMPMVQNVINESGKTFADINAIAVSVGPGSFTGVRVGLAAANGLAMASSLPICGVSVLKAMAFKTFEKQPEIEKLCVVLETKRDDYYFQAFERNSQKEITEPFAKTASEIKEFKDFSFVGNGCDRLKEEIPEINILQVDMITAVDVVKYAQNENAFKKEYPHPLYLRQAEVNLCQK